jgi:hypothetical protein
MKLSEVLDQAAEVLASEDNWTQGKLFRLKEDGNYAHCLMGAINFIKRGVILQAASEISDVLREQYPDMHFSFDPRYFYANVTAWNDSDATTHAEILAVLEKTFARLQEKGM